MNLLKNVKKIAVGMSGGVDSAVAALLLKQRGFDVVGVFMKNWDIADETGTCSSDADSADAAYVCDKLKIPFQEVSFVKPYWNEVFQELIEDYESGKTPNPDILCNKFIKFKRFCDHAVDKLGCDMMATGHYARRTFPEADSNENPHVRLLKALDPDKDQTFFLSQIPQDSLKLTLFPLGNYFKCEVKNIAIAHGLEKIARKKESMGMCFIGNRDFPKFIEDYVESREGVFIDIDSGKTIGRHFGKHHFTVGQRCPVGGSTERVYIVRKSENEEIYSAIGHDHPILHSKFIFTSPPHWICAEPVEFGRGCFMTCQYRFQHRDPLVNCSVFKRPSGELFIVLEDSLRALTPGQFSVLYRGDECLGSARITYAGPSEYALNYGKHENEDISQNSTLKTSALN